MTDNPIDSVVTDAMPQMVAAGAVAYRSITGGSVNYDAMQAALEAALPLAMSQASPPPLSDEVERLRERIEGFANKAQGIADTLWQQNKAASRQWGDFGRDLRALTACRMGGTDE